MYFKKKVQKKQKNESKNPPASSAPCVLTDENTHKNNMHRLPLAKIKWKKRWACAKIRKECEKITKKSEFEA
jgi:hypothetical protein